MALELVFSCPRTLKKLRSGPLGRLLEGFCDWLLEHGFTRYSARKHLCNVSHLNKYLGARNEASWHTLSTQDVNAFVRQYRLWARNRGPLDQHLSRVKFSVSRFIEYLRSSDLFEPSANTPIYQPLRDEYLQWMREHQHAAAGTIELRSRSISQFLQWLGPQATPQGCLELSAETVERFFCPMLRRWAAQYGARCKRRCALSYASVSITAMSNGPWTALCRHCAPTSWPRFRVD